MRWVVVGCFLGVEAWILGGDGEGGCESEGEEEGGGCGELHGECWRLWIELLGCL